MKKTCDAIGAIRSGLRYQNNVCVYVPPKMIEMTANCLHVFCNLDNDKRETIEEYLRERFNVETARVFNTPAVDSLNGENNRIHP